jgi:hypothetical protein
MRNKSSEYMEGMALKYRKIKTEDKITDIVKGQNKKRKKESKISVKDQTKEGLKQVRKEEKTE